MNCLKVFKNIFLLNIKLYYFKNKEVFNVVYNANRVMTETFKNY